MSLPDPQFRDLLQAVIDGSATSDERELLAAELRASAERRAEYVRQLRIDALLQFTGGRTVSPPAHTPAWSGWRRPLAWAAAVALIAAGVEFGSRFVPEAEVDGRTGGSILRAPQAVFLCSFRRPAG